LAANVKKRPLAAGNIGIYGGLKFYLLFRDGHFIIEALEHV
jgi:hypothetical protein